MKVMTIVGARPQFVKAAVVSRAFRGRGQDVNEIIVHTGQHYDQNMSDVFFNELAIPKPDHNLGIGGGTHGQNTGRMIEKLERLMLDVKPNWVLLYGDTDSTLSGALAATKLHIPVAHVEAGLRSFNRMMPEEINRVLTDHVAEILFVPTDAGRDNLIKEGISEERVRLVGDVMYDASLFYRKRARPPRLTTPGPIHDGRGFVLCTIHRAENTDHPERLKGIFRGLALSGELIILPMHPRTKEKVKKYCITIPDNVFVIDPVSYLEMVWLEDNCRLIVTDSGGVQKEAYFFGKFCVTMREETEWVELIHSGCNKLVGTDSALIAKYIKEPLCYAQRNPVYGAGNAAELIVNQLVSPDCGEAMEFSR